MQHDQAWIEDILEAGVRIARHVEGLDFQAFLDSPMASDAVLYRLLVMGEAAKHVSDETRDATPEINWKGVAGFRDVAIHNCRDVRLAAVWEIVTVDLPALLTQLAAMLEEPTDDD
jgi:uncharacterized protein with HEPN domain